MAPSLRGASITCAVVALCCYANTLDCGLCYDDQPAIIDNGDLRQSSPWSNLLWNDFWGSPVRSNSSHKSYRPLCVATFRLNYLLHELQPMGYHLVNVLLHSAVCYLYVQLCGVLFSEVWPALIAGLLFAVHPIHTEAVAAITGRAEVLSGFFFIAALLCYHRAATPAATRWQWLCLSMLLCLCATLSKETGFTAVAVCIVLDYFIEHKMDVLLSLRMLRSKTELPKWFSRFCWRAITVSVFASIVLAVRLQLNQGLPKFTIHDNPPTTFPSPYRQLQWLHLCFVNAWLLLKPSTLSCDWRMGGVERITSILSRQNVATIATLASIGVLTRHALLHGSHAKSYNCLADVHSTQTKKRGPVVLAIAIVVFSYVPASNLFLSVGFYVAERVLYIPSMGFCMLVAYGFWLILQSLKSKRTKGVMLLAIGYLLVTHSVKTVSRNRDWYSSFRLYRSSVATFPRNAHMISNLAVEYNAVLGNDTKAEAVFRMAIELGPEVTKTHLALGKLLNAQQRYNEAEQVLQRAAALAHTDSIAKLRADIYYELGKVLVRHEPANNTNTSRRLKDALKYYTAARELFPDETKFMHGQGHTLYKLNRHTEARNVLQSVLMRDPDHTGANFALGETMLSLNEPTQAEHYFRRVLALNGSQVYAKFHLAALLVKVNTNRERTLEAEKLLLDLRDLQPHDDSILYALGVVYSNLGDRDDQAMEMFKKASEINDRHSNALYNLGLMHIKQNNFTGAIDYFSKVLSAYPEHMKSISQLARCYLELGAYERAIELYESALQINPDHRPTITNLGSLLEQLGRPRDAEKVLSRDSNPPSRQ